MIGGAPHIHPCAQRAEQVVVERRVVPWGQLQVGELRRPRALACDLAQLPVGRLVEVVRGLHGQAGAFAELAHQVRIQQGVVRYPLQRGIGQDQVLRLGGSPAGNVGNDRAHTRDAQPLALTGLVDHVRVAVQRRHLSIGVTLQQHFGRVTGAAPQVGGVAHRPWRDGGNQVAYGACAFVFEQGILVGRPGHVRLLWAGNVPSICHLSPGGTVANGLPRN